METLRREKREGGAFCSRIKEEEERGKKEQTRMENNLICTNHPSDQSINQ